MSYVEPWGIIEENKESAYLRLFPFSLTGKAKIWLQSQPNQSLTSWEDVERNFLTRFFPPSKYLVAKYAIAIFSQTTDEPLCEAWERFKSLLRKCPNHGFDILAQLNMFCNGLRPQEKMLLDASIGGSMMTKSAEEVMEIIEAITANAIKHIITKVYLQKKKGILKLDIQSAILNKLIPQQMEGLKKQMTKM